VALSLWSPLVADPTYRSEAKSHELVLTCPLPFPFPSCRRQATVLAAAAAVPHRKVAVSGRAGAERVRFRVWNPGAGGGGIRAAGAPARCRGGGEDHFTTEQSFANTESQTTNPKILTPNPDPGT